MAGALAGLGGRAGRRAATTGWLAIALHSALFNHPIKRLVRRQRPALDRVPPRRHPATTTTTHAFPSGHTGSAVAFSVGVTGVHPAAAAPLAAACALIGYSRVHAGVHHPSDVAAGAVTGGLAGLLARRLLPRLRRRVSRSRDGAH